MAGALFVVIAVAVLGSSLDALDTRGADLEPGFGSPGEIGELLLTEVPDPVRGGVVPAARGGRRARSCSPAAGAGSRRSGA